MVVGYVIFHAWSLVVANRDVQNRPNERYSPDLVTKPDLTLHKDEFTIM